MKDMKRIIFRCPPELLEAIEARAAAANLSVGIYVRQLCERDTGIEVEVKKGLAGSDESTVKRVQRLGVKAFVASTRKGKGK